MTTRWDNLSVSLADAILTVSLNRPNLNALSVGLLTDLEQVFAYASKNSDVKGVHLRSNMSSVFCAGVDLAYPYERCLARDRPALEEFFFQTVHRGFGAPLYCSKPVSCSLDGDAFAGGLILALSCDHIAMGTRKPFQIGLPELFVGVPFPPVPLNIIRHQLEPQLAQRLVFDGNLISSTDFPIRCDRGETPDELSKKWLKMVIERPPAAFAMTKKRWWADLTATDNNSTEQERKEHVNALLSDDCIEAMKKALQK